MRFFVWITGLVVVVTSLGCAHHLEKPDPQASLGEWHNKMHGMANTLTQLMPLTVSQRVFDAPKNADAIKQEMGNLKKIAHSVDLTQHKPNHDPAMNLMAQRLVENVDEAVLQLEQGNRKYARQLIQGSTNHCISCHTRTDDGRSNMKLSSLANISSLSQVEQVDFLIALRDYDQALKVFEKMVNSPDAQIQHPYEIELAAKKALAIAIRVKRDPKQAGELVSRIIEAQWAPVYLRLNALVWKASINSWKEETALKKTNEQTQFLMAKELLRRGWNANANSPLGQAGLVFFLRASTILHELSGKSQKQPLYGEYLYYSGLAAEALRDTNLWTLQDAYYEACIRFSPRSTLAKKCYLRLETLQFSAYSAEDGTRLPHSVQRRLIELRDLSEMPQERFDDWFLLGE